MKRLAYFTLDPDPRPQTPDAKLIFNRTINYSFRIFIPTR